MSRSTGMRIDQVDFSGPQPVWSTLHPAAGQCYGTLYDRDHELLYTRIYFPYPTPPVLEAIDVNLQSPTYGQLVASVALPLNVTYAPTLALGGGFIAAVGGSCPSSALSLIDANPASPSYLQILSVTPLPQQQTCLGGYGPVPVGVAVSRDAQYVHVLTRAGGPMGCNVWPYPGIARLHVPTGAWEDFDPAQAGVQIVSGYSQPPLWFAPNIQQMAVSRTGSFAIAGGLGWWARAGFTRAHRARCQSSVRVTVPVLLHRHGHGAVG